MVIIFIIYIIFLDYILSETKYKFARNISDDDDLLKASNFFFHPDKLIDEIHLGPLAKILEQYYFHLTAFYDKDLFQKD